MTFVKRQNTVSTYTNLQLLDINKQKKKKGQKQRGREDS